MPANLSPDYLDAEERFRRARDVAEKISCLEEMLRLVPKHKGTEKIQADIKTRLARLRRQPKKSGAARAAAHVIPREGAAQIALVGPPNTGKSTLVKTLTRAEPEVAEYPFTTREAVPGMMPFEDIAFQLIDLPPLSDVHVEFWVWDLIRHADFVWCVVTVENSLDGIREVTDLLAEKKIRLCPAGREDDAHAPGWTEQPALLVVTGVDRKGGEEDIRILEELMEDPWPFVAVAAPAGRGVEALGRRTFEALDLVRVYTKQPGKEADRARPFTFRRGATVGELARTIHADVLEGLKFARIWGAAAFDGQTVQKDHVLADGDVVELHC